MVCGLDSNLRRLPSTVNFVTSFEEGGVRFVRKTFGPYANRTGVKLPVARCTIERRVHNAVAELVEAPLRLPPIVRQLSTSTENVFEFVSGHPLRQLEEALWPPEHVLWRLGHFLANVEEISDNQVSALFKGLEEPEKKLREAIILHKVGTQDIDPSDARLCLGDVGLGNLLWDGNTLSILDFEFAHREAYGFDAGQLCAELKAREIAKKLTRRFTNALVSGYEENGGQREGMIAWSFRFKNFYERKYRREMLV